MSELEVQGVVHWSIPVNNLVESEKFYGELLGLAPKGRLGGSGMSCFKAGDHHILLCERKEALTRTPQQDNRLHQRSGSPEMWERGCKILHKNGVKIAEPIVYRDKGHFTGRELYFLDPNGNMLELCDPTWKPGMPTPTYEEIVGK
jgi:extradiol dioxygenase family protein